MGDDISMASRKFFRFANGKRKFLPITKGIVGAREIEWKVKTLFL